MAEKREGMTEAITAVKTVAKNSINKVALIGFIGAAVVLGLCTAPFALAAYWWNQAPPEAAPVVRPLQRQGPCRADQVLGYWDDATGRHFFCTAKGGW